MMAPEAYHQEPIPETDPKLLFYQNKVYICHTYRKFTFSVNIYVHEQDTRKIKGITTDMKVFQTIFVSGDGRVRSGWRLLLQLALSALFLILFQLLISPFGGRNLQIIAGGAAITLGIIIAAAMLDKRPLRDFGLSMNVVWWKECGIGFLMAAAVMSLIVLIQWLAGWVEFNGFGWNRASDRSFFPIFAGYVVTMAFVGFYEELWTRGYQIRNITEGLHSGKNRNAAGIGAIVITSLVFGLLHMGNPNATVFSIVVIIMAGVMLAVPFVITGRLGLSIGIHFGWNVIQGAFYGLPVSGIRFRQSLLQFEMTGPELWTGGRFGPEGGLLGVAGVVVLAVITTVWLGWKGYSITISEELVRPPSTSDY
jgi:uncharacterized protein